MAKTACTGRTRHSGGRAAVPVLPEDLFLWEILIRLPAMTLHRCREVCRSWRRLITSDTDFLLAHHRLQPSLPLVAFVGDRHQSRTLDAFDGDELESRTLDAFDLRQSPAERCPVLRFHDYDDFLVHASCDGLLLLSSDGRFSICNPVTRQRTKLLTSLTGVEVVGMYQHSSSGEYRVLYWKSIGRPQKLGGSVFAYYVLTVGSSAEPRCIGLPIPSPPPIERSNMVGLKYVRNRPPVLLRSCLHWGRRTVKNQLIVFDTVAESFRCMRSPITYHLSRSRLLEMDGVLGISHFDVNKPVVDLWVLDDYEQEVWSLKYRIDLPAAQLRGIAKTNEWYFNGLVVSDNGDVLVYFNRDLHLFHCNCNGVLLQEFPLDRAISWPLGFWFKGSLVRHTFFERN